MQVIGFNFTKISAEKAQTSKNLKINSNIEFINLEKEKIDLLKDSEAVKVYFKHSLTYETDEEKKETPKAGELLFEGTMLLSVTKQEAKDIFKNWKKKQIHPSLRMPLFNLILKRCAPKAMQLQEEIGLPSHIPIPRLTQKQ